MNRWIALMVFFQTALSYGVTGIGAPVDPDLVASAVELPNCGSNFDKEKCYSEIRDAVKAQAQGSFHVRLNELIEADLTSKGYGLSPSLGRGWVPNNDVLVGRQGLDATFEKTTDYSRLSNENVSAWGAFQFSQGKIIIRRTYTKQDSGRTFQVMTFTTVNHTPINVTPVQGSNGVIKHSFRIESQKVVETGAGPLGAGSSAGRR